MEARATRVESSTTNPRRFPRRPSTIPTSNKGIYNYTYIWYINKVGRKQGALLRWGLGGGSGGGGWRRLLLGLRRRFGHSINRLTDILYDLQCYLGPSRRPALPPRGMVFAGCNALVALPKSMTRADRPSLDTSWRWLDKLYTII